MSTNLICNGNFSLPSITANTIISSTSFTTDQATAFYWTPGGSYMSLLNGLPTTYFITPSLVGFTQACYLLLGTSIQQSFSVPFAGSYILSFYYSIRTGYPLSMQVYINGVLFDTVVPTSTIWNRYIITVSNVNRYIITVNTILFQASSGAGNAIVITGISFVYGQTGGAPPLSIASYNNFKTTSSFTPSGSLTIPIGVYIVDAYCLFTPGSSATHTLKLGISTTSGALTTFNYTIDITLTASALAHSIQYKYILSNTASTSYFFVFNTQIAGSIAIGGFNGKFIRIG